MQTLQNHTILFTPYYYGRMVSAFAYDVKIDIGDFNNLYDASKACVTAGQKGYAERMNQITETRNDYYAALGIPPGPPTAKGIYGEAEYSGVYGEYVIEPLGDYSVPTGWPMKPYKRPYGGTPGPPVMYEKPSDPEDEGAGYGYSNGMSQQERDVFYYHSDHLGSTSYITDRDGNASQFVCYKPYGDALVDEHNTSYEQPWKFNGKELDSETGLYYYGARYYEPVLAMWYGVDAMAEKNPNMGGYVYCAGNPVMYIDPDGNIKIRFKVGFSMNSGIVGAGFKFLGLKYIFDGAKEININVSISYDTEQNQLYIGSERAETTFTEGDLSIAGLYGASDTRQKNSSDEVVVGLDFDENAFFSDNDTKNEKKSHRVEEGTIGMYTYKVDDTKKSEMSISTDAHIDAVLVGVKVEAGLYIEDANQ